MADQESGSAIFNYIQIENFDFHCCGRFPGGMALAASLAKLGPGSKAHAIPLGVAASISINYNLSNY